MRDRGPTLHPRTLTQLGFAPPANWLSLTDGERLDFIQQILDAAVAAYRRIDSASLAATRSEISQRVPTSQTPWSVTA